MFQIKVNVALRVLPNDSYWCSVVDSTMWKTSGVIHQPSISITFHFLALTSAGAKSLWQKKPTIAQESTNEHQHKQPHIYTLCSENKTKHLLASSINTKSFSCLSFSLSFCMCMWLWGQHPLSPLWRVRVYMLLLVLLHKRDPAACNQRGNTSHMMVTLLLLCHTLYMFVTTHHNS